MTDAGWRREKPTAAGWYWFRTEVTEEEICRIYQDADDMLVTCTEWDEVYRLDDVLIKAEFLGPISPTDRAEGRVEGLREIGDYAATECVVQCSDGDRWQCGHNAAGKWIASVCEKKIREAGL